MKVGTDGVLLGAWCNSDKRANALDIGTGTGLIALMLAQRDASLQITAIEPNANACADAKINFQNSNWANRIDLHQLELAEYTPHGSFDLIISNPPFFHGALKNPNHGKTMARHAISFDSNALLNTAKWLSPLGIIAGIYPTEIFEKMQESASQYKLFLQRACTVKPTPEKVGHRVLFEFGFNPCDQPTFETLVIESDGRHRYSDDYKSLTRDFYLNF